MSRTSICSIVALELIDYAKKTETEQLEIKGKLESLIQQAVEDIAQENRIVLNTEQGAVIACCGPMEDALEDALLIALKMRDEILNNNAVSFKPIYVQFGINIGSVLMSVKGGQHDVAGAGVEEALRIMTFANPNQILVSRVYYEMASRVTQEIASMFEHYDMHALDQELYAVKLHREQLAVAEPMEIPLSEAAPDKWMLFFRKINWTYAAISLFLLVGLIYMGRNAMRPQVPMIVMDEPVGTMSAQASEAHQTMNAAKAIDSSPTAETTSQQSSSAQASPSAAPTTEVAPVEAKAEEMSGATNKAAASNTAKLATARSESKPRNLTRDRDRKAANTTAETKIEPAPVNDTVTEPQDKETHHAVTASTKSTESKSSGTGSTWQSIKESVKQGANHKCTQAQIAMNQCN